MTCIAGATVPDLRHPGAVPDAATVFLHQTGRLQEAHEEKFQPCYPTVRSYLTEPEHNPYLWHTKVVSQQKPPWNRRTCREGQNPYTLTGSGVNYSYPAQDEGLGVHNDAYYTHQQVASARRSGAFTLGGVQGAHAEKHTRPHSREKWLGSVSPPQLERPHSQHEFERPATHASGVRIHSHSARPQSCRGSRPQSSERGSRPRRRCQSASLEGRDRHLDRQRQRVARARQETRGYGACRVPINPTATDGYWLTERSDRSEHQKRTWAWQR